MKLRILIMQVCLLIPVHAMEVIVEPTTQANNAVATIVSDLEKNIVVCKETHFAGYFKAYRAEKTTRTKDILLELWNSADENLRVRYGVILQQYQYTLESLEADQPSREGDATLDRKKGLEKALDMLRLSALKKLLVVRDCPEKVAEVAKLVAILKSSRFTEVRQELVVVQEGRSASPEPQKDRGGPYLSPQNARIPELRANTRRAYIKTRTKLGRGIVLLNLEQLPYFSTLLMQYEDGTDVGHSIENPIPIPFWKEDFVRLSTYVDMLLQDGSEILGDEVNGQLNGDIQQLAKLINQASKLEIDVLLKEFLILFEELVRSKKAVEGFAVLRNLFLTDDEIKSFSPAVQDRLSQLFFPAGLQEKLLSLLRSELTGESARIWRRAALGYFYTVRDEGGSSFFEVWDAYDREKLFSHKIAESVKAFALCQSPLAVLCTSGEALSIDCGGRCSQRLTANEIGFIPNFSALAVSPDKTTCVLCCAQGIVFWDIISGDYSVHTHDKKFIAEAEGTLEFSSDGSVLMEVRSSVVHFWDTRTKKVLVSSEIHSSPVTFQKATQSGVFITADAAGVVHVWSESGHKITTLNVDGKVLCADSKGKRLIVQGASTCDLIEMSSDQHDEGASYSRSPIKDLTQVTAAHVSPDESVVAFICADRTIEIRETADWRLVTRLETQATDCMFSSDGKHLIVREADAITLWHYFDSRLAFVRNPMVMAEAFLFSQGTDLLAGDASHIRPVARALLEGAEAGSRVLLAIALGQTDEQEPVADSQTVTDSQAASSLENEREARELHEQALALLKDEKNEQAVELFEKFVGMNHELSDLRLSAWLRLGELYRSGKGVKQNLPRAFICFEQAAVRDTQKGSHEQVLPQSKPAEKKA